MNNLWAIAPNREHLVKAYSNNPKPRARRFNAAQFGSRSSPGDSGNLAIIDVAGVLDGAELSRIRRQLDEAVAARGVEAILLNVYSDGGQFAGFPELADHIFSSRQRKLIVGHANAVAGSAAFVLLSATSFAAVKPSGQVGGLGIFAMHMDVSGMLKKDGIQITLFSAGKYKIDGHPYGPPSESYSEHTQSVVDHYHKMLIDRVAKYRGTRSNIVQYGYGQGRMVLAKDALEARMVDAVLPLDKFVQVLANSSRTFAGQRASASDRRNDVYNRIRYFL